MTDKIAKLTKILLWILIALSAFFGLMLFLNLNDSNWIDNALIFAEVILFITIGTAIFSSLFVFTMRLIEKPKQTFKSIITIVILSVILLLAFTLSPNEALNMPNYDGTDNVPKIVKWTGTGIIVMYILLSLAILSIIFVEIRRFFK